MSTCRWASVPGQEGEGKGPAGEMHTFLVLAFFLAPFLLFFGAGICEQQSRVSQWACGHGQADHAADRGRGRGPIVLSGSAGGEPDCIKVQAARRGSRAIVEAGERGAPAGGGVWSRSTSSPASDDGKRCARRLTDL